MIRLTSALLITLIILLGTGGCIEHNAAERRKEIAREINFPSANDHTLNERPNNNWHSNAILLACYTIAQGKVEEAHFPVINEDLFIYYADYINCSLADLTALQHDYEKAHQIWDITTSLYPENLRDYIAYFQLFTDGDKSLISSVQGVEGDMEQFILSIDLLDILDDNHQIDHDLLLETLIHELGHIITLNNRQTRYVVYKQANTQTYYIHELTLDTLPGSYLDLFFQYFWSGIYEEWSDLNNHYLALNGNEHNKFMETDLLFNELLDDFYHKYDDHFVSRYASTSPVEDIAESFSHFIREEKPPGDMVFEQKILFFYDFPALINIRHHIRHYLSSLQGS